MNLFSVYTLDEEKEWKSKVESFEKYDIYYSPNYVKAFQLHGDGEPLLIYYENKKDDFKAMNVVMKRDISEDENLKDKVDNNTYFDLSTPYGYGGLLIEGNKNIDKNIFNFKEQYINYCINNNIVSEFVRFHPLNKNNESAESIYNVVDLSKTVSIDLTTPDEIWDNLVGKNRNVIRKAVKSDVKVYWGRDLRLLDDFISLYNETMDRDKADEYYYFGEEYYKSVLEDLKYDMLFFYAVVDNEIASIAMILLGEDYMHYHLSASNKNYYKIAANNYLLYEAAAWGAENGFKKFHLGGGVGSSKDSLFKFKKSFSKKDTETTFFIGKRVFIKELYEEFVNLSRTSLNHPEDNNDFFPLYRQ